MFEDALSANYCLAGVFDEAQLIAYIVYTQVLDEGQLLNVAVHPQWQGQGHARGLMQYMIQDVELKHVQRMFLEVRRSNKGAIELYRSLGFSVIGERKAYYPKKADGDCPEIAREDAWVMMKQLLE